MTFRTSNNYYFNRFKINCQLFDIATLPISMAGFGQRVMVIKIVIFHCVFYPLRLLQP